MARTRSRPRAGAADAAGLAARRRRHIGRLLFELSAQFERESLARIRAAGLPELTQSQKQTMVHLPVSGARLTDLAARMGITKQAAMKLVDGLSSAGLVSREGDVADGRAKRVVWTERGLEWLAQSLAIVDEMESEWRARIRAQRFDAMREALTELAAELGVGAPEESEPGARAPRRAR